MKRLRPAKRRLVRAKISASDVRGKAPPSLGDGVVGIRTGARFSTNSLIFCTVGAILFFQFRFKNQNAFPLFRRLFASVAGRTPRLLLPEVMATLRTWSMSLASFGQDFGCRGHLAEEEWRLWKLWN